MSGSSSSLLDYRAGPRTNKQTLNTNILKTGIAINMWFSAFERGKGLELNGFTPQNTSFRALFRPTNGF